LVEAAVDRAATLGPGALAGAAALVTGLLPVPDEPGLNTLSMLGEGLAAKTGDLTPGVRLAKEAPPTEDVLDVGADGFLGLRAPGRGAIDGREVRDGVVDGGAIVCLLASGLAVSGPVDGGAIDALFPAAPPGGPLMLCRAALAADVPADVPADAILDGLGFVAAGAAGLPFGFGAAGFGCSRTAIEDDGCMNKPCCGGQSKYLSPLTEPSFLPSGSSSSKPIHCPSLKETSPMKRTMPTLPSAIWTFCPTLKDMVTVGAGRVSYFASPEEPSDCEVGSWRPQLRMFI
jgi:hypothetical protein